MNRLPPRLFPILYFGLAHVALALAFAAVALDPRGVAGFFYHARMLAIVHLVALPSRPAGASRRRGPRLDTAQVVTTLAHAYRRQTLVRGVLPPCDRPSTRQAGW